MVADDVWALRAFGEIAGTYRVAPISNGSRLVVQWLVRRPRNALRWLSPLLPVGDLVMTRKQLFNLKACAERGLT